MSRSVIAAAAVLMAAVLVAACSASATPAPSAAAPSALPAGTYTSTAFQPPATYTLPAGWEKAADSTAYLWLRPAGNEVVGIHFFRDAVAASQDPTCPTEPAAGVGTTAADLVAWIGERPGLTVSAPVATTTGGLRGFVIDVAIIDGWLFSCPFAEGLPTVPLLVGKDPGFRWVVAGNERLRMYILDLPGGGTVIVDVDAFDGDLFDAFAEQAAPIVISLEFATG